MIRYLYVSLILILFAACNATKAKTSEETDTIKKESKVIHLNLESFKKEVWDFEKSPDTWAYKGNKPCIIDFYADWCGPCNKVSPVLDKLSFEYKDDIIIYKVDTDKNPELTKLFGIRGIPAFLFIPEKGKPFMQTGALRKSKFNQMIDELLLNKKK